jgi:hypothetical protein
MAKAKKAKKQKKVKKLRAEDGVVSTYTRYRDDVSDLRLLSEYKELTNKQAALVLSVGDALATHLLEESFTPTCDTLKNAVKALFLALGRRSKWTVTTETGQFRSADNVLKILDVLAYAVNSDVITLANEGVSEDYVRQQLGLLSGAGLIPDTTATGLLRIEAGVVDLEVLFDRHFEMITVLQEGFSNDPAAEEVYVTLTDAKDRVIVDKALVTGYRCHGQANSSGETVGRRIKDLLDITSHGVTSAD